MPPRAPGRLDDHLGVVETGGEIDRTMVGVVVDRVDDVGLDRETGEGQVAGQDEEARVDEVGRQAHLPSHPVHVLEVLREHEDDLVAGTLQRWPRRDRPLRLSATVS